MNLAIHRPRLLPATIAAMALLLAVKSASLVWAATGGGKAAAETAPDAAPGQTEPQNQPQAHARGEGPTQGAPPPMAAATPPAAATAVAAGDPAPGPALDQTAPSVSDAERAVLLDLRHRRVELDDRSRELDQRSAVLSAAEARVTARVEQLSALQAKLEQLETDRRAHDDANWTGLVHVYETMKPREAAAIFDALDMQVLLAVLDRMQPRRAAPVLAAMQPDRARLATQMLAELRTRAITPAPSAASQGPPAAVPAAGAPKG
jgi:flagellar motility protein MotE (MotC chaperone)